MQGWKNYKIIFSDFDGTLAGHDFQLSSNLKTAINLWQKQGNHFIITTGKPYPGVIENACKYLEIKGLIIVNGGSAIIDTVSNKTIYKECIPTYSVLKINEFLNSKKIVFEARTDKYNYASSPKLKIINSFRTYLDLSELPISSVIFYRIRTTHYSSSIIEMVKKELENTFPLLHIVEANGPDSKGLEISSKHTSKHTAVLKVMNMFNVTPQETIGIGDEMNDYPLLTACGYKVVMENGNKDLKAIANEIIPSYLENGVAKFIEKILR